MIKIFILILLVLVNTNLLFANDKISNAIKVVMLNNLKYTQNEKTEKVMSTMHSQSPSYMVTKNALTSVFKPYDLKYDLLSYKYIAYDGDLVYIRIKQSTKKISGPAFNNNIIDSVLVFRKEDGKWKIWSQMIISINYINKSI